MLLEFISELFSDFSPIYIYLSVLFSMILALQIVPFVTDSLMKHRKLSKAELHARACNTIHLQEPKPMQAEERNWLVRKTKRIEAPDDESDSESFLFQTTLKKQGGAQWNIDLYSHSFGNIVL
ncbi:hypothetical protein [Ornithinibacillus contaminans]|uniref:hypothetical protein n=1 Tax=Ornithinibacillus contaminans TaxID=694055 RepID=UPI00064D8E86|nr:hypothetical protein [Ornithinibacillus contaminans]